jgi:hypothetical protein
MERTTKNLGDQFKSSAYNKYDIGKMVKKGAGSEEPLNREILGNGELSEQEKITVLKDLAKKGADRGMIISAMSGMDSAEAWSLRLESLELAEETKDSATIKITKNDIAAGLGGLDDKKAWDMRQNLIKDDIDLEAICLSLRSLDSSKAWETR